MLRIAEQFHASDLGRQRQGNEDNYFVRSPLFVVADGMGGAQAGEVASEMAVEAFDAGIGYGSPADGLVQIIQEANRRIHDRSRSDEQAAGMGTTCTAAYVGDGDVFLLCSDGLTSMIHEPGVRPVMERMTELDRAGRELIAAANEAGGRDNITVILFRLESVDGSSGES